MKVLCTLDLGLAPDALTPLRAVAEVDHRMLDRQQLLECIDQYDAYLCGAELPLDAELIARADRLIVVATPSTGTDHIDKAALQARGIPLLALTTEYALLDSFTATAEGAWGLLLACHRRIPAAFAAACAGDWARTRFTSRQLSGKTLGVLGVGRLGKMVVEYGKAFRMRVLGCDVKELSIPGMEQVDFDTLLRESDVISIHVHLNDETRGMLSHDAFARMKDGVVIVNTARGAIIDEAAFLAALESGKVGSAGLDVIDGEWMEGIGRHPLIQYARQHDNLVITPHTASATVESIAGGRIFIAQKLADYLAKL